MKTKNTLKAISFIALTALLSVLYACSKPNSSNKASEPEPKKVRSEFDLGNANKAFIQSLAEAAKLAQQQSIDFQQSSYDFLEQVNQSQLDRARAQWVGLETALQQLHALVIIGQNDAKSFNETNEYLYRIQAHPILPGYLDRFGEYAYSGLVFDIGFPLTRENLIHQHGLTDREEAVLGIYAIEFMLFGINDNRAASDYQQQAKLSQAHIKQGLQSTSEIPENRRRNLLSLQIEQLVRDVNELSRRLNSPQSLEIWRQQTPQQQVSIIRRSLNSGLTQLLIQLADYQNTYVDTKEDSLPETIDDNLRQDLLRKLATHLQSFSPWASYFSEVEKEAINDAINSSANLLNSKELQENTDPQAATESLKTVYDKIKILI